MCTYACVDEDHTAVLRRWHDRVSRTLEAQSVADYMLTCQALNERDFDSIKTRRNDRFAAAEQLLNIVKKGPYTAYVCFLDALNETGHQHVRELIETGNIQGTRQECARELVT